MLDENPEDREARLARESPFLSDEDVANLIIYLPDRGSHIDEGLATSINMGLQHYQEKLLKVRRWKGRSGKC